MKTWQKFDLIVFVQFIIRDSLNNRKGHTDSRPVDRILLGLQYAFDVTIFFL